MQWLQELRKKYQQGYRAFLLTGNVHGQFPSLVNGKPSESLQFLEDFLYDNVHLITGRRSNDVLLALDAAQGFSFPDEQYRQEFKDILFPPSASDNDSSKISSDLLGESLQPSQPPVTLPSKPLDALEWIRIGVSNAELLRKRFVILLPHVDIMAPDTMVKTDYSGIHALAITTLVKRCMGNLENHVVIMTSPTLAQVHERLRTTENIIASVDVPKPSESERKLWLIQACRSTGESPRYRMPSMSMRSLVSNTQGLGYDEIKMILEGAHAQSRRVSRKDLSDRRIDLLHRHYGDILEIIQPTHGFSGIVGLDPMKEYFHFICRMIRKAEYRRVPMGCILMGSPGVGKSLFARALAWELGILCLFVRNLRNKWMGETERSAERVSRALRELAPAIVLRDEVDEEEQGRNNDNGGDYGVSGRLRKMWRDLLGDETLRGKIFFVSCTNRPDRLDSADKRSGRNDERIFIPRPNHATRSSLFEFMLKRAGFRFDTSMKFDVYAERSNGLTGADIEVVVRRAFDFASSDGGTIRDAHLLRAVEDFIPSDSQKEVARMELLAIEGVSSRRWLPDDVEQIKARARAILDM